MSVDEPFYFDSDALPREPSDFETSRLMAEISMLQKFVYVVGDNAALRLVETPDNQPLKIDWSWDLNRKLSYLRLRQANAVQMFQARADIDLPGFGMATAVNLQRFLESLNFAPRRNWRYYPVVDRSLGCGVPRAQKEIAMLKFAQYVITDRNYQLLVYHADTKLVHPLAQEQFK